MTKEQGDENLEIRKKLLEKKQESPGMDWIIRENKLCQTQTPVLTAKEVRQELHKKKRNGRTWIIYHGKIIQVNKN